MWLSTNEESPPYTGFNRLPVNSSALGYYVHCIFYSENPKEGFSLLY
jgi:hypothetical protein